MRFRQNMKYNKKKLEVDSRSIIGRENILIFFDNLSGRLVFLIIKDISSCDKCDKLQMLNIIHKGQKRIKYSNLLF